MNYFEDVLSNISVEELLILNELYSSESFNAYSSISNVELKQRTKLSEAVYRKVISNLIRLQFIKHQSGTKTHSYYISPYGSLAVNKITEGVGEIC